MIWKNRAIEIEDKAQKQRESLACISNTAPFNVQVRLQAYSLIWHLKQKYHNPENPLSYVSKRDYEADLERVKVIESRILKGGLDELRAQKAIAEVKEYLSIVAKARIRDNRKCRVF